MMIFSLCVTNNAEAIVRHPTDAQETLRQLSKKEKRKLLRSHRKTIKKALKKQARNVFQSGNFKLGLALLLGGILVTILLSSLLSWIGVVAILAGIGLMLWALIRNI